MTIRSYQLRFWGVRGTVATPEAGKLGYGGNTSCLAVDLGDQEHLILDCGTGIRLLGNQQARRPGSHKYHIFISHYHLDHIIGLPFFQPLYDKSSTIVFHGFGQGHRSVMEVLQRFMAPPFFPVPLKDVPSTVQYVIDDRKPVQVGGLTVSSLALNHPDGCLSYRLDNGDRRVVYATDHEHGNDKTDQGLIKFSQGADHLIYDAMYLETEYENLRRGWGHSTWYAAVRVALAAGVKNLVLFHHNPEHTDPELEKLLGLAREEMPSSHLAAEGMELPF